MTAAGKPFADRRRSILINFGASHSYPHGARVRSHEKFDPAISRIFELDSTRDDLSKAPTDPYDRTMWEQTNHRHCRAYYERLKASQAVSAFCGELIPPMPWRNPAGYLVGGNKAKILRFLYSTLGHVDPRPERIVQWDSWRFWEALAAGCACFHMDLDRYGALLPVMPVNGAHYFGVDMERPGDLIDRIAAEPGLVERVAEAGRKWATANYSPAGAARRFLAQLGHRVP
jgi:hypothetical protein